MTDLSDKKEEKDDEKEVYFDLKSPRRISNDINEGKTVFLKNLPFSVKNDELKRCMEQFGPVYYALVCIDVLTEHSKGTAFVKFKVKYLIIDQFQDYLRILHDFMLIVILLQFF